MQNLNDGARYALRDNDERTIQGELTAPEGPVAYYARLPIRAMVRAMRSAGIPADISDVGGTFCCNHLMYGILHHIAVNKLAVRAGWIHLPYLPEVATLGANLGAPSMSVDTAAAGVRAAIEAICTHPLDVNDAVARYRRGHALGARHSCGAHRMFDRQEERHRSGALPAMT